jgi:hypothetical protein
VTTPFSNSLTGQQGSLVRAQIKSPNFNLAQLIGWAILKNGNAYFNNVNLTGTFTGTNYVLNSNGLFLYSGAPALGNMILSVAQAAGTDLEGNVYPRGLKVYNGLLTIEAPAQINMPTGAVFEATAGNIFSAVVGSGAAAFLQTLISGPKSNVVDDWVQTQWNSSNDGGTTSANYQLIYVDSGGTAHNYGVIDKTGFNGYGNFQGAHPGTTPAVIETWQQLGTGMGATWTVNNTRYRMTSDGECEIDIAVNAQAGGGAAGVFQFANALGALYQFAGNYSRACPLTFNGTITAGTNQPGLLVDGAGTSSPGRVRILVPALPATSNVGGTVRIPLT